MSLARTKALNKDVTERTQAEELLREAQRRTESILASVTDTHIVFDRQWHYTYINEAAVRSIGRARDQIIGRTLWELYPDIVGTEIERQYRRAMEERVAVAFEFHYLTLDSWWDNRFNPVPEGLAVFATNITERKRAEAERAQLAAIVRSSDDAIIAETLDGIVLSWNQGAVRMYGYTAEEAVGMPISRLIPSDHPDELAAILQRLARGEHLDRYETARIRKDGQRIDVSLTISPIRDASGHICSASIVARDTTERNRVEDATRKSQQQLRALSAHLQTIREEERTRIAREIHDELGQALTGLKLQLSLLEESWRGSTGRDPRTLYEAAFQRMRGLVDGSIETVRKIATELRPMMLDHLGLPAAIEWQADEFLKTSGISCEVSLPEEEMSLDRDTSTALFRILQESLTNIVRHAKASRVSVHLWNENHITVLQVQDNGVGMPAELIAGPASFGLLSMKERALMLGGTVDVMSGPGAGTKIVVRVPDAAREDEEVQP
jgi:PAS domain S-box-containing protein